MQAAVRQTTPHPARLESIDIFRGLTILVMVFVNDVSGVRGLPWWTHHMPTEANGMTYVDMVFPTFLFIVGLSIPLALERRIARGDPRRTIWTHVLLRSLGLVAMGLVLANLGRVDPVFTGISATAWRLLAFAAIILIWGSYSSSVARAVGAGLLACLLLIYRRRLAGQPAWLDLSYLEILGLIGWAYLSSCIVYLLLRTRPWMLAASLALLNLLNVLCTARVLRWRAPIGDPALTSIVMAGVIASLIFTRVKRHRALIIAGYALVLLLCGLVETPLGISKNRGTPAWCLLCAAAAVGIFAGLFWLADVRRATHWADFAKPAGSNTLMTYLLPWIWYSIPGLNYVPARLETGVAGVGKAVCFTAIILSISAVLTRMKVRLQL